ncbi:hypothetical protein PUN28_018857 [Cardiocondyla obscurior]|uniref:Uncharacterized protein n=1 Tax=Cardiocondyla obscurior TaxID=286306 RepID=A0AAW2EG76_9HYME
MSRAQTVFYSISFALVPSASKRTLLFASASAPSHSPSPPFVLRLHEEKEKRRGGKNPGENAERHKTEREEGRERQGECQICADSLFRSSCGGALKDAPPESGRRRSSFSTLDHFFAPPFIPAPPEIDSRIDFSLTVRKKKKKEKKRNNNSVIRELKFFDRRTLNGVLEGQ